MHPEAWDPSLPQRAAEGCPTGEDSVALLSLSISLCLGNAKLWQGASLPPTASSCESRFPIQAIYMVFWPLCDQALANYLLPGGQNPGFSVQYWNQLTGKIQNKQTKTQKNAARMLWGKKMSRFFFAGFFMFTTCHSPVFYYFRYAVFYSLSHAKNSTFHSKLQTYLCVEARSCPSPCSDSICCEGGIASVSFCQE